MTQITDTLIDQAEQVRSSGRTNMFDRFGAQRVASDLGLFELALFVADTTTRDWVALLDALGTRLKETSR